MTPIRLLPIVLLALPTLAAGLAAVRTTRATRVDLGQPALPRPLAPSEKPAPEPRLRVISLNAAHGRALSYHQALLSRTSIQQNLTRIGSVLTREAPDIVALQEVDGPSVWSGHFDQVGSLAAFAGFEHTWRGTHGTSVGPFELDYGTALLARLPIWRVESHLFDASWRDNKGFVVGRVAIPGFDGLEVDVASVHLDFARASLRAEQVETLVAALRDRGRPLVVVGDFNCGWQEPTCLPALCDGLGLRPPESGDPTYPADDPSMRIDWILASGELAFEAYATLPDLLSDHRAVVADLSLAESR